MSKLAQAERAITRSQRELEEQKAAITAKEEEVQEVQKQLQKADELGFAAELEANGKEHDQRHLFSELAKLATSKPFSTLVGPSCTTLRRPELILRPGAQCTSYLHG